MTRKQLISHPTTPLSQVNSLCVDLSPADDGGLEVRFDCRCVAGALRLPEVRAVEVADELWRETCCELFVGVTGDAAYREFNFSPSGQWAMYDFSDCRLRDSSGIKRSAPAPRIRFASNGEGWSLHARLDAAALPPGPAERIELGVAAVLQAAGGGLSYWALRHTAMQPDFHRRESFVLCLAELT